MSSRAAVFEGLIGPGGSISKVNHSPGGQVDAGCWWEASASLHMGLPTRLPECPPDMTSNFCGAHRPRLRQQGES